MPKPAPRKLVRAYVDETGDRGSSGKSSPYFAFAAVVVADEDDPLLRAAVSRLRTDFKIPVGKALHWMEHVKTYARRQHTAAVLGALDSVAVNYVVVEKAAIPSNAGMRTDHVAFYNYAAGIAMERILLTARDWSSGPRDVKVRFGHVRGFDHRTTTSYFARKRSGGPDWVPWRLLRGAVEFDGMANWDGLQAADQFAGMLNCAISPDQFGGYEAAHLLAVRDRIRRNAQGSSWGYGFKWLGHAPSVQALPWWPASGL